jgi:hypothetical protein
MQPLPRNKDDGLSTVVETLNPRGEESEINNNQKF